MLCFGAFLLALLGRVAPAVAATEIVLKDGRSLSGREGLTTGMADNPVNGFGPQGPLQLIVFLDDDLRRTYFSKRQVREVRQSGEGTLERFSVPQRVMRTGLTVKTVGPIIAIEPFDEYGRRIFTMNTFKGAVPVVQAITEITPHWTKVEGISHVWDMRMATSSIPREVLGKILMRRIDPKDIEQRKKIARFYLQSERYEDAIKELEAIMADFPTAALQGQIASSLHALRQLAAERLLSELRLRREAGQHRLVMRSLEHFPTEGVNGEVLQVVREMIGDYQALDDRRKQSLAKIDELLAKVSDSYQLKPLRPIRDEIAAELSANTSGRMTSFLQGLDDPQTTPAEKLALAVSGWLLGSDAATAKLGVAISAFHIRQTVQEYLNEPQKANRAKLFATLISSEQAATPQLVAALLTQMKPPLDLPAATPGKPGFYELAVLEGSTDPPVHYLVQLPPEYDPHRRYPAIVTLHGAGTTAENQIDWWAGAPEKAGARAGQASRHGYIVIAPDWTLDHQRDYRYSGREHAAVLDSLRDACRRFSIDGDRVFLSGHSIGGDAAWDIALAHPDFWAGAIPIVATADRYIRLYWENAKPLPCYFVCGELDGNKMTLNAPDLDRYLKRGYNCTVTEFLGRGHEDFSDEIQRLFDWMGRFHRDFFPRDFTCSTMRRFDNYFWWVEMDKNGMPSGSMVAPTDWPPPRGTQAMQVKGSITSNNGLNVRTGSTHCTVWIAPQMIDFGRRVNVVVNGRRLNGQLARPDLQVLLEDVRARGDRQHPFWAKLETATGRINEERER
jgi:pimeloyl-ACP methyl ester carboxylesterase